MQSSPKFALITIRPPKSASPSPGLCTTPGIASEYDDRAAARVSAPDSEEGQALTEYSQEQHRSVRRAARPFVVLVPRRGVAAGRARRQRRRARLSSARAHRPRRGLRLARVRTRGQALRRASYHRRRADARGRLARDRPRGDREGLREPLPPDYRG